MAEFDELLKKFDDAPEPEPGPPRGKVLVIDDNANIRQGLERTLTQRNYEVIITTLGQDGIDSLGRAIRIIVQIP